MRVYEESHQGPFDGDEMSALDCGDSFMDAYTCQNLMYFTI